MNPLEALFNAIVSFLQALLDLLRGFFEAIIAFLQAILSAITSLF
jgi:hypothetical protein